MLCVNVDTEEEFQWAKTFSKENTSTRASRYLHLGQDIFKKYELKPTYLIDYPITNDEYAAELLGDWSRSGECLVGAQLHPWVNPPYEEVVCVQNSYPCNLPLNLEKRKLEVLTQAITEAIGTAPRIYKAGRYGIDIRRTGILESLGYCVDTSVVPYRSYAGAGGGTDFYGFASQPFWIEEQDNVLFLPVTQELVGLLRHIGRKGGSRYLFNRLSSKFHLPGLFSRMGLLERIMLSPEGLSDKDLLRLLDCMVSDGHKVFCLSFHSPTLMTGSTPYTRNSEDLNRFLRRIEMVLDHFFGKLGGVATNPIALYDLWKGNMPADIRQGQSS